MGAYQVQNDICVLYNILPLVRRNLQAGDVLGTTNVQGEVLQSIPISGVLRDLGRAIAVRDLAVGKEFDEISLARLLRT